GAADGAVAQLRTRVFAAYDDKNLYVAFQIDRPTNSLKPGTSDSVSVLLDPAHDHKAPLNFSGTVEGPIAGKDWEYKARVTDVGWEGEISIPFASLKRSAPKPGEVWGFDFVNRQETPVPDVSALSFTTNRETSRDFSHVVFTPADSPVVRFREAGT